MNFFSQGKTKADPVKVQQLKTWIYELFKTRSGDCGID